MKQVITIRLEPGFRAFLEQLPGESLGDKVEQLLKFASIAGYGWINVPTPLASDTAAILESRLSALEARLGLWHQAAP